MEILKNMNETQYSNLQWHQLQADAGQILDIKYAVNWEERILFCKSWDRSNNTTSITYSFINGGEFEPQNGKLPTHGEWVAVPDA
jgi:hypothetical protein